MPGTIDEWQADLDEKKARDAVAHEGWVDLDAQNFSTTAHAELQLAERTYKGRLDKIESAKGYLKQFKGALKALTDDGYPDPPPVTLTAATIQEIRDSIAGQQAAVAAAGIEQMATAIGVSLSAPTPK